MAIAIERRKEIVEHYRRNDTDTGSPEVQVAILTEEIRDLTEHLKDHKHDYSSRRGLLDKVSRRNRLTTYLKKKDLGRYQTLIKSLGLRK